MKGTKKILTAALAGVMGLSMLTSPVFAVGGTDQNDVGENSNDDISLNYNYLNVVNNVEYISEGSNLITTDIGYAWDDLSWTYVKEVNNVYRLTTAGHQLESSSESGAWYTGSMTQQQFSQLSSEDRQARRLPTLTIDQIAMNKIMERPMYNSTELAKTPKLVLHNYSQNNVKFSFAIPNSEYSAYNASGVLMLLDEAGMDVDAFSDTFTSSNGYMVSGDINLLAGNTNKYGVTPMVTVNSEFAPFTTTLTLNFKSAN